MTEVNQYQCVIVDFAYYDNEKNILVQVEDDGDKIDIFAEIEGIKIVVSDEYYLVAYQKFRDELLQLEYGLKCNGSRINAIQSGMMGYSDKVYLVEMGQQALLNQSVCIWDYANMDNFPDTKMQLDYAEKWYGSLAI